MIKFKYDKILSFQHFVIFEMNLIATSKNYKIRNFGLKSNVLYYILK